MHKKSFPGQIQLCHLSSDPNLYYYLYLPKCMTSHPQWMVTVHGISRNAREHILYLAPYAEKMGWLLLAPLFDRRRFTDYQRLGRRGKGERADLKLNQILAETGSRFDLDSNRFHLFGYSGGGQFAHRYAMAHPERILSLAVGAAGWYTFPDPEITYPRGIRPNRKLPDVDFQLECFLRIPTLVLVGEHDDRPDAELNTNPRIECQQGSSRLERGRNWILALEKTAREYNLPSRHTFDILPGAGHSFRQCIHAGLGERLSEFLLSFSQSTPKPILNRDSLSPI